MKNLFLSIIILLLMAPAFSSAEDLYEAQLNKGIKNSDPYTFLLIEQARNDRSNAEKFLKEALRYSPDLPTVYFEFSSENFSLDANGFFQTIDYLRQGIEAYKRNFWWSFMLTASLVSGLVFSFLVSMLVYVIVRIPADVPLFMHDLKENKSRLTALLVFVFAVFGPLYLLASLLVLVSLYKGKWEKFVLYIFLAFLFISPVLFHLFTLFVTAPASGEARGVVQVNEGRGNSYAISVLQNSAEPDALFSYGIALKREGRYEDAVKVYNKLLETKPDPRVYNNLANCYFAMNNLDRAKELYLKAKELKINPAVLYNLSQAYRETLDFEKGEEFFLSAQALDRAAVSQFRSVAGRNPNRLVTDETLSFAELWRYVRNIKVKTSTLGFSLLPAGFIPVIAGFLALFFFFIDRRFRNWAYRCKRCGKILCSSCEKHILWGHMCRNCYRSIIRLEELDSKERVSRLLVVYEHQTKRRKIIRLFSFLLPGLAQMYAGSSLQGFLFMWPFLFFLFLPFTNAVFAPEIPGSLPLWFNLASLFILAVIYSLTNILTRRRISKGWL